MVTVPTVFCSCVPALGQEGGRGIKRGDGEQRVVMVRESCFPANIGAISFLDKDYLLCGV